MRMQDDQLINERVRKFNRISENYQPFQDVIGRDHLARLVAFSQQFRDDADALLQENRNLRIGVVGQINAGKSSFLNAFLFEANDMLPKAATPMTAALTIIKYDVTPRVEVEFYSEDDWGIIEGKAREYDEIIEKTRQKIQKERQKQGVLAKGIHIKEVSKISTEERPITEDEVKTRARIPEEIKAAKELASMASATAKTHLGQTQTIDIRQLYDYVGVAGTFTPIVKSLSLFVNDETIKHLEIIDTPGINDPIISRGQKTRELLGKCDAIFLLSYAGQFLDASDIGLLTQNISGKGIRNVVLLGSKFDSVLLDGGRKYTGDLKKAVNDLRQKLGTHANDMLLPILSHSPDDNVLQSLKNSLPPQFISSMAHAIALHFNHLNEEEQFLLARMEKTFPKFRFTPELLKELSNIQEIKHNEFERIYKGKDEILAKRFDDLLVSQRKDFENKLHDMSEELKKMLDKLENADIQALQQQQQFMSNGIRNASRKVAMKFDDAITKMKTDFEILKLELEKESIRYKELSIKDGTNEESYTVDTTEWWNPLSWGNEEIRYRTVNYKYANVHEAIDKVNEFVLHAKTRLIDRIRNIFNQKNLKDNLINAILGAFDLSDENFDADEILFPVNKTLNNISIPYVNLDSSRYEKKIISTFSQNKVTGDDVERLRRLQWQLIGEVMDYVKDLVSRKAEEIVHELEKAAKTFIEDVLVEKERNLQKIKEMLNDKQYHKNRIEDVIKRIDNDIAALKH